MHDVFRHGKRVGTAIGGAIVVIVGIVMIPYPGPGWLVVFAGLAILSTEFKFADRWLKWLKIRYQMWLEWVKLQPVVTRVVVLAFTGLVILVTLWFLNTFGLINHFLQLQQPWLQSPFLRN